MNNLLHIRVSAPAGAEPYTIDQVAIDGELRAALAFPFLPDHDAVTAGVWCDPADEAAVRAVIQAHIDNTEKREANKGVLKQIAYLEATVTQRMMRERGQRLTDIDEQIAELRGQLQK